MIWNLEVGPLPTNCYLVGEAGGEAAVVDPGEEPDRILAELARHNLSLRYILLTHGHPDHIGAVARVREVTGAPVLAHAAEEPVLALGLDIFGRPMPRVAPERWLADGEELPLGPGKVRVIHTPGHTPGGVCYLLGDDLFSGDTLFAGSVGRTDLPGGSQTDLLYSIWKKILVLPGTVRVHPGHGPSTALEEERDSNPFLI